MAHDGLIRVQNGIREAATVAGRDPASIQLIAVSKTFDAPDIVPVLEAGQRRFGENRVQEAKAKWPQLRLRWPDVELHLIGPLQTNKAADAVALFDVIQTVDRPKLATALAREIKKQALNRKVFIQVNIGREAQKAGVPPDDVDGFHRFCRAEAGLRIRGLMCIPPADEDPRPYFESLRALAEDQALPELSMGMSGDYPIAISAGATCVRIGSAIFGGRHPAAG